jgi:hypothetical protein
LKKPLSLVLAMFIAALLLVPAAPALAGKPGTSDIETYRGTASVDQPGVVTFTTYPNDTGVIISFKARNGGDRRLDVYDSAGNLVAVITVPGEVTSVWSTHIAVSPSSTYTVVIHVSAGSTKYTLYVNHCPDGVCF